MVIAIDGPSGSGKSTVAKLISDELGIYYLNSGAFYRTISYKSLVEKVNLSDNARLIKIAQEINFEVIDRILYANGKVVDYNALQTEEIGLLSSKISVILEVREAVSRAIYKIVQSNSLVCEGRDMTTVVFPNAEFKFYLDANIEVRAKRRFEQASNGQSLEEIYNALSVRDENDKNKPVGALKIAKTANYIDTSYLTTIQVYEKVLEVVKSKINCN